MNRSYTDKGVMEGVRFATAREGAMEFYGGGHVRLATGRGLCSRRMPYHDSQHCTLHIFSYQLISTCGFYICNILDPWSLFVGRLQAFFHRVATSSHFFQTSFRVPMILTKIIIRGKGVLGGAFCIVHCTIQTILYPGGRSYRWDNSV